MARRDQGVVPVGPGYAAFRELSFSLLARDTPPAAVHLAEAPVRQVDVKLVPTPELPGTTLPRGVGPISVPRAFVRRARRVLCHRDVDRYDLLYRILWRLTHGERNFLSHSDHPDVRRFGFMDSAVTDDVQRFQRKLTFGQHRVHSGSILIAYYRPEHHTLRLVAPDLARQHPDHRWSVFTPSESAFWDGEVVRYGQGASQALAKQPRMLLQAVQLAFMQADEVV